MQLVNIDWWGEFFFKNSNSQVIDNPFSINTMSVSSGAHACIILQTVTTEEEFTDVSTNTVLNDKFTTRVIIHKVFDIKN